MSTVNFCSECNNMTYIFISEEKELIQVCKSCNHQEKFVGENNCIYESKFTKFDTSYIINMNKYITQDVTLPTIDGNSNIKCPNEECISIKEHKESSITYLKYDDIDMKYIYICKHCGQKWTNN